MRSVFSLIREYFVYCFRVIKQYSLNWYWDFKDSRQTLEVNGVSAEFDARSDEGGDIIRWTHDIEKQWLQVMLEELEEDDVLFDVGANLGFYACFAAQKLDDGNVIAFEPYPPNYEQLQENLKYNDGRSKIIEQALSDSSDTVTFTGPPTDRVGFATASISPDGSSDGYEVDTIDGDTFIQKNDVPHPTVVKIDVEGSEPLVLEGMEETLNDERCRLVFCEVHLPKEEKENTRPSIRDYGSSREEIKKFLKDSGFELERIDKRNRELHIKGRKKETVNANA